MNNFDNNSPDSLSPNQDDRRIAAIMHLVFFANYLLPLIFTGIIILILIKAGKNNFTNYLSMQWREALNFNISIIIYGIIFGILCIILIGFPLLFILFLYSVIVPIVAAVKTLDGQEFRYPLILRLI
ncbi:MAG: DUF4870 domain-containing protein [Gammaproteobacteria bacterium]|nr:DUF4870 domain-containing protein [Gammaproteobacteria bacterium]